MTGDPSDGGSDGAVTAETVDDGDGTAPTAGEGTGGSGRTGEEFSPEIGLLGAVAIGVGTMIAAGIFVLSGLAVGKVGAVAVVSFLLAAIVAGFTAASYAEFSSVYRESGGGYMYVANTFDVDAVYLMGWTMILGYPASAAFYLASFSDWFYEFLYPVFGIPTWVPFWVPGLGTLAMLIGINLKGTEESNQFQIAVTAVKVALILLFLYGGLQTFRTDVVVDSFTTHIDDVVAIGTTSALVFITFFGFSAIATNAEEIEDPGRTIPRAIYLSMGIVTIVYTLVVFVIVLAVNNADFLRFLASVSPHVGSAAGAPEFVANHGEVSMGYAAQYYLGDVGFYVIIVGALFSMLSAANATIMAGSRVKLAMARRDHLPSRFESIHPDWNTPYMTVLLTGGIILTYLIVFTILLGTRPAAISLPVGPDLGIPGLTQFANALLIGGLTTVNVALIASRRKYPDIDRGFEVPFVPYVPAFGVVVNVVLLANVGPVALGMALVAELIGVGIWFTWKGGEPSTDRIEEETPTVVADHTGPDRDFQIVVPIANPDHVEQLMRTATTIAADRDGEILAVSVVTVPQQTPLSAGRERADEKRAVLDRARAYVEERDVDVPVNGVVRIGHHPSDAIVNTVAQHDSDAVLVGWQGDRKRRRDVVLGTTVDDVVAEADCDAYVEKIGVRSDREVGTVLLPVAGGPHAELAAETAGAAARTTGAEVRAINVVPPDADEGDRERARERLAAAADEMDVDATTELVESDDVGNAIVEESSDADLTVIGATRGGVLEQLLFGAIPETVGQRSPNTVVMAKRDLDVTSRVQQGIDHLRDRLAA